MAQHLDAKAAGDTVTRRWLAPVADGDSASSITASASGVTLSTYSLEGDEAVFELTAGSNGATGTISVSVTTSIGDVLTETLYIAIIASTSSGPTARDFANFALRKVNGLGSDPDASQEADALERLEDMLRHWSVTGAAIGVTFPLSAATALNIADAYQSAIKNNLILQLADLYGTEISPVVIENARRGLQLIKSANLPNVTVEYY
jgi:hypothetical protein